MGWMEFDAESDVDRLLGLAAGQVDSVGAFAALIDHEVGEERAGEAEDEGGKPGEAVLTALSTHAGVGDVAEDVDHGVAHLVVALVVLVVPLHK